MSLGRYLKERMGELILVVASAWAVGTVGLNAFFLDGLLEALGWWGRAALALAVVAALVLLLYVAAYRRGRRLAGAAVYVAVVAALVAAALACSTGESVYQDAEGNYLYLVFVLVASATACFLLTRTLTGSLTWFVAAAFACSVVQAFYESEELGLSVVASLTALALIVHRNFTLGMEQAHVATAPSRAGVFAASVGPVAVVVACALGVWFGVIAPLSPGVLDMKLVTEYRSLPIVELKGTSEEEPQLNTDLTSDSLVEGFSYTTDDLVRDPTSSVIIDATSLLEQRMREQLADQDEAGGSSGGGEDDALDEDSLEEDYAPSSYSITFPMAVLIVLASLAVVLLVVGYFVGRRRWRTRRLRTLLALPPEEQVEGIYRFLLTRLARLGFSQPAGVTLSRWARMSAHGMEVIDEVARVPFRRLTDIYVACVYGDYEPTEDDVVPFAVYYLNFWKAARAYLGNLKYFFKSFRL